MPGIFISYRRADVSADAGRICDHLRRHFGTSRVFFDIDEISPSEDFVDLLEKRLSTCDILVVIIGSRWLSVTDENGRPRLDAESDFVHIEIATALQKKIAIFPILIGDARMPRL